MVVVRESSVQEKELQIGKVYNVLKGGLHPTNKYFRKVKTIKLVRKDSPFDYLYEMELFDGSVEQLMSVGISYIGEHQASLSSMSIFRDDRIYNFSNFRKIELGDKVVVNTVNGLMLFIFNENYYTVKCLKSFLESHYSYEHDDSLLDILNNIY